LVDQIDTRDSFALEAAWAQLRPLGYAVVAHLLAAYARFRTWQGRTALVYYAARYARLSDDAVPLGLLALADKSYMVRYRACGLLAYALQEENLPALRRVEQQDLKPLIRQSAQAACNAILARNHNLFIDHSLSGRSNWIVNPGDWLPEEKRPALPSLDQRLRLGIRPVPPIAYTAG